MKIIISPYSPRIDAERPNPKNYPWWKELIAELEKQHHVVQVGVKGEEKIVSGVMHENMNFEELKKMVEEFDLWIAVDNFFQHFVNADCGKKKGIMLWGQSDPERFGYGYNTNLIKDRIHLRPSQYDVWTNTPYFTECFVKPEVVLKEVEKFNG